MDDNRIYCDAGGELSKPTSVGWEVHVVFRQNEFIDIGGCIARWGKHATSTIQTERGRHMNAVHNGGMSSACD